MLIRNWITHNTQNNQKLDYLCHFATIGNCYYKLELAEFRLRSNMVMCMFVQAFDSRVFFKLFCSLVSSQLGHCCTCIFHFVF